MNIGMAIQAGARDEPQIRCFNRGAPEPLIAAVRNASMITSVVALLAQVRHSLVEQFRVQRTVRIVADEAILLHRRMLPHVRSALVGMAAGAELVHRFVLDHGLTQGAVRVVATGAGELAFQNRVVRGLQQLRPDLLVAPDAGLVLKLPARRHKWRDGRVVLPQRRVLQFMEDMAVGAGDVVFLVAPGVPESEVPVVDMTVHADLAPSVGRQGFRAWGGHTARALAAACFDVCFGLGMTDDASSGVGRALGVSLLAVDRSVETLDVVFMAAGADFRAGRTSALRMRGLDSRNQAARHPQQKYREKGEKFFRNCRQ